MTVPSGTQQTYTTTGNAEDFENAIFNISPTETPFVSMAKRLKADNRTHQWLTDELAAASATNASVEGDDASADSAVVRVNLKNYAQLMDRVAFVSSTQEATKSYGNGGSEMAYQVAKRAKELKRDLEAACLQNNAATVGAAASAALMASLESWLAYGGGQAASIKSANGTSVGEGTAQTTPGFTTANGVPLTAPTDSTSTGSVSETILNGCIANAYINGGEPSVILVPPLVKQKISRSFTGIATRYRDVPGGQRAQIVSGVDLFVSDFGEHKIMPDRFMRASTIFGIDPNYVGIAFLQPFQQKDLAVNGHAQKKMVYTEACLVVQNPWAHFKIGDVNPAK